MSSVRNNNTTFDNWRLSRIEEETERLSCSSSQDTSADDGSSSSPRSAEGTLERRLKAVQCTDDASIYSCTGVGGGGGGLSKEEEESSKDVALRFIKEKYDSLGKVKVKKPSGDVQPSVEGDEWQGHDASPSASCLVVESTEVVRTRELQEHLHRSLLTSSSDVTRSTIITEQEVNQVEMFYRSHKTNVFVCPCQATLYLSDPKRNSLCPLTPPAAQDRGGGRRSRQSLPPEAPPSAGGWTVVKSGVPVLVLDSGESRRQRRLHVVLAERGTGFCLWRDQIDCLTNYAVASVAFHTMQLSTDHSKTVGLRFDDPPSAAHFVHQIRRLTSDADDPLLSLASSSPSADDRRKKAKGKAKRTVTKADISQPCCFTHITKLDPSEGSNLLLRSDEHTGAQRHSLRPSGSAGDRLKVKLKP